MGQSWGVNESTAYRIIRKIEDTLIKSRVFTLPGKIKLVTSNHQFEGEQRDFLKSGKNE
ncbi:hypothetical protein [Nostoc sp.]|uniref:hypothetical protein n=1 Tax=Nostoc sp. TaxID=1180 RepID=UPI003FA56880